MNPYISNSIAQGLPFIKTQPSIARVFLKRGRAPEPGEVLQQRDLAMTMRAIAERGRDAFYKGEIAKRIARFCQGKGGLLEEGDLEEYRAIWVEPIDTDYRGYQVYEFPPNSQGMALLLALNLVEGFNLESLKGKPAEAIHIMVEAIKLAFADRDRYISDPRMVSIPLCGLLSKEYVKLRRNLIDPNSATRTLVVSGDPWPYHGDTTYFAIVDREFNVVSHIQSLYHPFGSRVVVEETGILLNGRLSAFTFNEGHPNRLEPYKRPLHTLNPALLFKDNKPYLALGTPRAHGQVQTLLQIITNHIDFGMDLQEAIEAPRWRFEEGELHLEDRFSPELKDALKRKGHTLRLVEPWSDTMGGAQGILIDPATNTLLGGADPRREGYAIGW